MTYRLGPQGPKEVTGIYKTRAELVATIHRMTAAGDPAQVIADYVKVAPGTVHGILKKYRDDLRQDRERAAKKLISKAWR